MKTKFLEFIEQKAFATAAISAAVMNILISCLHARSLTAGMGMLLSHPISALFNFCLLLACYIAALFFKRRIFAFSLISLIWLTIGVINCVLLGMRITPLQAIDFYIFRTGIAIIDAYMTPFQIVLAAIGVLIALTLIVLLFVKAPKSKTDLFHTMSAFLCVMLVLILFSLAFIGIGNADPGQFDDIKDAYDIYGFPYCFLRSFFDRGISQPDGYSEETVKKLLSELGKPENTAPTATPNIIFVQLESFFDITRMKNIEFSEDPIPNFRKLTQSCPSGLFRVPGIGSGTANTEFEVLTGLDIDFFGTGEYPYESILQKKCCETVAYDLAAFGYGTHAFHNHTATFYDRYRVYANLGFDSFTGAEHMKDLTYNELGWEKDEVLLGYIQKALDSTEGSDFVFAVSVEGHGGYPELPTGDRSITVTGLSDDATRNAYEYYANTLYSMDRFIGALVQALSAREEETVLVLYGDHIPALGMEEEDLREGGLTDTDYVIWSNRELPKSLSDRPLKASSLFPYLLSSYQMENGLLLRIYDRYADSESYMSRVKLIGYDSLYGDRLAYGEHFPFAARNMKMGIEPIVITDISSASNTDFFVHGKNFTPSSHVFLDGKQMDTLFISETTLYVGKKLPEDARIATVAQISSDLRILSHTPGYRILADDFLLN